MATWKELKAQGVKRCCAMYSNRRTGKSRQCHRRAIDGSWCEKHKAVMDRWAEFNRKAIESTLSDDGEGDDDE